MNRTHHAPEWPPSTCEDFQVWLNARADGECTPAQEGDLAEHLHGCAPCSREWAALERTRLFLETGQLREPTDFEVLALDKLMPARALLFFGWLLLIMAAFAIGGGILYGLFVEEPDEWPMVFGAGCGIVGLLMLFVRIAWERMRVAKIDPYRDVQR